MSVVAAIKRWKIMCDFGKRLTLFAIYFLATRCLTSWGLACRTRQLLGATLSDHHFDAPPPSSALT